MSLHRFEPQHIALAVLFFLTCGLMTLLTLRSLTHVGETVSIEAAVISRLVKVPEYSPVAAVSGSWLVELRRQDGELVESDMPFKPRIGERVCLVESIDSSKRRIFRIAGYIDALASEGQVCALTNERLRSINVVH